MEKKFFRIFSLVCILVLSLIILFSVYTQTSGFRGFLKNAVEKGLSTAVNQNFSIERIEGNLFDGFVAYGVRLDLDAKPFFVAEKLSIKYSILTLFDTSVIFNKVIPVESLHAEGVRLSLVREEDYSWNFMRIKRKRYVTKTKRINWGALLRRVTVKDCLITVDDKVRDEVVEYDVSNLHLSLKFFTRLKEMELTVSRGELDINPYNLHFRGLQTDIAFKNGKTKVEYLYTNFNGMAIKASGRVVGTRHLRFRATATIIGIDALEGIINAEIERISGSFSRERGLKASAKVKVLQSDYLGQTFTARLGDLRVNGTDVELKRSVVSTETGEIVVKGKASLQHLFTRKGRNTVDLKMLAFDLSNDMLGRFTDLVPPGFTSEGDVALTGTWTDRQSIDLVLDIHKLINSGTYGSLESVGTLKFGPSRVKIDVQSQIEALDLSEILFDQRLKTSIFSSFYINGTADYPVPGEDPSFTLRVRGDVFPSLALGTEFYQGTYDFVLDNSTIAFNSIDIVSDDIEVRSDSATSGGKLTFQANISDLTRLRPLFPGSKLSGSIEVSGTLHGDLPRHRVTLAGSTENLSFYTLFARDTAFTAHLDLSKDKPVLRLESSLTDLFYRGRQFKSAVIDADTDKDGIRGSVTLREDRNTRYSANYTIDELTPKSQKFTVTRLILQFADKAPASRTPIHISISPEGFSAENFNLYFKDNYLVGELQMDYQGPVSGNFKFSNLNLRDIYEVLNLGDYRLGGYATGELTLTGHFDSPRFSSGLSVRDLVFLDLECGAAKLRVDYADKKLAAAISLSDTKTGADATASADAFIDLNLNELESALEEGTMDFSLKSGKLDLSPLALFHVDVREISGAGSVNIKGTGPILHPKVYGNVEIGDAVVEFHELSNPMSLKSGSLEFKGNEVLASNIEILNKDGGAKFNGHMNTADYSYSFDGVLDNLLLRPVGVKVYVDGDVNVSGVLERAKLSGDIKVNRGRITVPDLPIKQVKDIRFVGQPELEFYVEEDIPVDAPLDKNLALDLGVNIPGNFWIKGKGTDMEVQGNFRAYKEYDSLVQILGEEVNVVRGTYELLGKRFTLEEGKVSFRGEPGVNPFLDIRASYTVSNILINISIGGTANNPVVRFTSDPPMDETDIFSYIVFGTSSRNLGTGERATLQGKMAEVVGHMLAGTVKNILGEAFGLDVITISGGETEFKASQLEVGKYLTDYFYVAYERSASLSSVTSEGIVHDSAKVQLRLFDFLTVESTIGSYNSGGDIFFNWSY